MLAAASHLYCEFQLLQHLTHWDQAALAQVLGLANSARC